MLQFNELFKVLFGVKGKFKARVSKECLISFTTPSYDLIDVRFQRSIWSFIIDRKATFEILENNVWLFQGNLNVSMFSNGSGKDPKKYPAVGQQKIRGKERFNALKPNTTYILRFTSKRAQKITYVGLF